MLGDADTAVVAADTPLRLERYRDTDRKTRYRTRPSEVGGVSFIVSRNAANTTFAALHEPFEGGKHRIYEYRLIARSDAAIAVAIAGRRAGVNDRAMVRFDGADGKPVTLSDERESFTFAGHAFVRIAVGKVEATGGLTGMRLRVDGKPGLLLNGKPVRTSVKAGVLLFPAE